jgi:tetratricopeptide (TPR) repeat protein
LKADRTDGSTQLTGLVAPEKARVLTYRGRASEARELIGGYLAKAREVRDPQILVRSLVAGAVAAMGLDDRGGAIALMEELTKSGTPFDRYWALPEGARILVQAGAPDLAERLVEGDGSVPTMPNVRAAADFGRATIHEAAGRHDEALGLYLAAAAWWDPRGFVYNEAQAILGSARCEASLGAVAEAAAKLHRVAEIFDRLGARALLPEVDRLTEALAMRKSARFG